MALPNSTLKRLPPRAPARAASSWRAHRATFLATIVLALVLSVLPLPDAFRPFPKLRESPKITLARLVFARVFFRADSMTLALAMFSQLGTLTFDLARVSWLAWGALSACIVFSVLPAPVFEKRNAVFLESRVGARFCAGGVGADHPTCPPCGGAALHLLSVLSA